MRDGLNWKDFASECFWMLLRCLHGWGSMAIGCWRGHSCLRPCLALALCVESWRKRGGLRMQSSMRARRTSSRTTQNPRLAQSPAGVTCSPLQSTPCHSVEEYFQTQSCREVYLFHSFPSFLLCHVFTMLIIVFYKCYCPCCFVESWGLASCVEADWEVHTFPAVSLAHESCFGLTDEVAVAIKIEFGFAHRVSRCTAMKFIERGFAHGDGQKGVVWLCVNESIWQTPNWFCCLTLFLLNPLGVSLKRRNRSWQRREIWKPRILDHLGYS